MSAAVACAIRDAAAVVATPKPVEHVVNASDAQEEEHVGECGSVPAGAAIPPSPAGCDSSRAASSYDREQLVVACISASCDMMHEKSGRAAGHSDMLHVGLISVGFMLSWQ